MQNIILRQTGKQITGVSINKIDDKFLETYLPEQNVRFAALSNLKVITILVQEINNIEKNILKQIRIKKEDGQIS